MRLVYLILLIPITCLSQTPTIDSLKKLVANAKNDTVKINALIAWDDLIYVIDPETDFKINKEIISIAEKHIKTKINSKEKKFYVNAAGFAYNAIGIHYQDKGDNENAMASYEKGLYYRKILNDQKGIASSYNNIGLNNYYQGKFQLAIEYYMKSLKIRENIKDESGISAIYGNLANIYDEQGDYKKAIEYNEKCLKLKRKLNDLYGMGININNIGVILFNLGNTEKALNYYKESLKLRLEIGDEIGIAGSYNNIGNIHQIQNNLDSALYYYELSRTIREHINDVKGLTGLYGNIGMIYFVKKKYDKSLTFCLKAYEIAKSANAIMEQRESAKNLYLCYKAKKQFKEAYSFLEISTYLNDTIKSLQNQKEIIRQEFKYQYEKKAAADSIFNAKEQEIKNSEILRQKAEIKAKRNQQFLLFGGLALVIIFAIIMYNRFKLTAKQKKEIENQKLILEEKQKEILDSIHYAKRIQMALLPSDNYIDKQLKIKSR